MLEEYNEHGDVVNIKGSLLKLIGVMPRGARKRIIKISFTNLPFLLRLLFGVDPPRIEYPYQLLLKALNGAEDYEDLTIQTLQKRIKAIVYGETTGRFIVITNPSLVGDYMRYIGSSEGEFREKIKGYLKDIEEFLLAEDAAEKSMFLKTIEENKFLKTLTHEYLHWYMLKETSTATVIESMSWMIRLLQIVLTEILHREIKSLPRVIDFNPMNKNEAKKKINEISKDIERIAQNPVALEIFRSLVSQIFIVYIIISDAVATIVEPITWVLMREPSPMDMLKGYFSYNAESYNLAKEILEKTADIFKKYSERYVLEMARKSLDIPLDEFNSYFKEKKIPVEGLFYNELSAYYCRRFIKLADGEPAVRTSEEKDKSYATVLNYTFGSNPKITPGLIGILSEILSEEKDAFDFIVRRILEISSKGVYAQPSVFVINPETLGFYRYDPLAGLTERESAINVYVKRTGRMFGGLEDLVGDLPLTHRDLLLELFYRGIREEWSGEDGGPITVSLKYYENITKEVIDLDYTYGEIGEIGEWHLKKVIDLVRGDINEEVFRDYLRSWSYMIFRLGSGVKSICGLHGIWRNPFI